MSRIAISTALSNALVRIVPKSEIAQQIITGKNNPKRRYGWLDVVILDNIRLKFSVLPIEHMPKVDSVWNNPYRITLSARKVIEDLFPEPKYSDSQLRVFINELKKLIITAPVAFEELKGEELRRAFLETSVHPMAGENSTLSKSCMRHPRCQPYLDIYVDNPDVVSLAVAKRDNAIVARALLWQAFEAETDKPVVVLDRCYYINEYDRHKLYEHFPHDMYRATRELRMFTPDSAEMMPYPSLYVPIQPADEYDVYPFVDTFYMYAPLYQRLYTKTPHCNHFEFREIDGNFHTRRGPWNEKIPKGSIYVTSGNCVVPIEDTEIYEGVRYRRSDLINCTGCVDEEVRRPKQCMNKIHTYYLCNRHYLGDHRWMIGRQIWRMCDKCDAHYQNTGRNICNTCLAKYAICEDCSKCKSDAVLNGDGKTRCATCSLILARKGKSQCQHCGYWKDDSSINTWNVDLKVCDSCQKDYTKCANCDKMARKLGTYIIKPDKIYVCSQCATKLSSNCAYCGDRWLKIECTRDTRNEWAVCPTCMKNKRQCRTCGEITSNYRTSSCACDGDLSF